MKLSHFICPRELFETDCDKERKDRWQYVILSIVIDGRVLALHQIKYSTMKTVFYLKFFLMIMNHLYVEVVELENKIFYWCIFQDTAM